MSSSEHKSGRAWKALEWLCIKRPLLLQTAGLGGLEVLVQTVQTSARFTDAYQPSRIQWQFERLTRSPNKNLRGKLDLH